MVDLKSLGWEFLDKSPDGILLLNEKKEVVWVNAIVRHYVKDLPEDLEASPISFERFVDPGRWEVMSSFLAEVRERPGVPRQYPNITRRRFEDEELYLEITVVYVKPYYMIHVRNITKEEKLFSEVQSLRAKYEQLFEYYPAAVYLEEMDGTIIACNRTAEFQTGYSRAELLKMKSWDLARPEDLEEVEELLRDRLYPGGPPVVVQSFNRRKDGSVFPVEASIQMIEIEGKSYVLVVVHDISDRVEMQKRVAESEEKYRAVFEQAQDAFIVFNREGYVVDVNPSACHLYGYTREEFIGLHGTKFVTEAYHGLFREFLEVVPQGFPFRGESIDRRKDGTEFYIEVVGGPITFNEELHLLAVVRDVTNQKKLRNQLAEEREKYYLTLESIGDGVISTDASGYIVYCNRAAEEITGYDFKDMMHRELNEVLHLVDGNTGERYFIPVHSILAKKETVRLPPRTILIDKEGNEKFIDDSVAPIISPGNGQSLGLIIILRDVTEKVRLEEELLKQEKLESLSVLAGGIAHDFNNLLTSVLTNLSLVKMEVEGRPDLVELLDQARHAAKRARRLTSQLLTFSKGGAPVKEATSIVELAEETAKFVLSGSNVKLHIEAEPDLWSAHVDEGQIAQVFQNLIINAKEAMEESGGNIWITFQNYVHKGDAHPPSLEPGDYIKVTVRDDGPGIPEDVLPRLFEPFYSTKDEGSGLGLATVYSIIAQHEGTITVDSEPGQGATFVFYLPAVRKKARRTPSGLYDSQGGGGRILVMDDNEVVLSSVVRTIKRLGYEVEGAVDGKEAVEKYQKAMKEGRPFDLVIMDLTVPGGLGGKYAIAELKKIDPSVRAVVSSGYFTEPIMAEYHKYGFVDRIAKPFDVSDLRRILKKHIRKPKDKGKQG